jgi:hypothetical protein
MDGQTEMLSRIAGNYLIIWIPACAGMTLKIFFEMEVKLNGNRK